jgi:DNA polymerase III alpha subunit
VRDLAGYSMGQSGITCSAKSKKKEAVMQAERKIFVIRRQEKNYGLRQHGIPEEIANRFKDQ